MEKRIFKNSTRAYRPRRFSWKGVLCLLLCFSMLAGYFVNLGGMRGFGAEEDAVQPLSVTPGTIDNAADGNTMDSYRQLLDLSSNSRYAGRIWADKTVFAAGVPSGTAFNGTTLSLDMNTDGVNSQVTANGDHEDFLHVFSALGSSQAANDVRTTPLDVMIVWDMSGSMGQTASNGTTTNSDDTRLHSAITALNYAIDELMKQNNYNRVGLYIYSGNDSYYYTYAEALTDAGDGTEVLTLGRYTPTAAGTTQYFKINSGQVNGSASGYNRFTMSPTLQGDGGPYSGSVVFSGPNNNGIRAEGATNTQVAMYRAMSKLAATQDTTVLIEGQVVTRIPMVILVTDGLPTMSYDCTEWWNPGNDTGTRYGGLLTGYYAHYQGDGQTGYYGNGMLLMATASYWKAKINDRYYGNRNASGIYSAKVYTIGIDLANNDKEFAAAVLDPKETHKAGATGTAGQIWTAWQSSQRGETPRITVNNGQTYQFTRPTTDNIDTLIYNDKYWTPSSGNLRDVFEEIFDLLRFDIFAPVAGVNDLGVNDYLTYMDPIGKYMEVKDVKGVLLFGRLYPVTKGARQYYTASGAPAGANNYDYYEDSYLLANTQLANPCYGYDAETGAANQPFNLSDIKIFVRTTGDVSDPSLGGGIHSDRESDQALYVSIPVAALPLIVANVDVNGQGVVESYSTNIVDKTESTPLRVFYTVGMDSDYLTADGRIDMSKISSAYKQKNTKPNGRVYFYSNWYNENTYNDYVTGETAGASKGYTYGDPVLSFSPKADNRYYIFQKALPLYKAVGVGPEDAATAGGEVTGSLTDGWQFKAGEGGGTAIGALVTSADELVGADQCFYIVIDYYKADPGGVGEAVHRAVARRGSEFGADIGSPQTGAGAYVCWYNITTGETRDFNGGQSPGAGWCLATKPGGLRVGDMAQSVHAKGEYESIGNKTDTAATFYLPTISATSGADASSIKVNLYLGNNGYLSLADTELIISKVMDGTVQAGDTYTFNVTLTGADGQPLTGTYHAYIHETDHKVTDSVAGGERACTAADHPHTATGCNGDLTLENGTASFTLAAGQTCVITGLPLGAHFVVKEDITVDVDADHSYLTPKFVVDNGKGGGSSGVGYQAEGNLNTATSDEEAVPAVRVIFTNKVVQSGDLIVTKTVMGAGDTTREWHFTVTLTPPEGVSLAASYNYVKTGPGPDDVEEGALLVSGGRLSFTLKHGQSITIKGLPDGTSYTVTEAEADTGGYVTDKDDTGNGTLTADGAQVDFVNTPYGALAIEKLVTGVSTDDTAFEFTIKLTPPEGMELEDSYTYRGETVDGVTGATAPAVDTLTLTAVRDTDGNMLYYEGRVTLKHGQRIVIDGLPAGTDYEVVETNVPSGYWQDEEATTGASGSIPVDDTVTAHFENAKQFMMPAAGGEGAGWMAQLGIMLLTLLSAAGVCLARIRRRA